MKEWIHTCPAGVKTDTLDGLSLHIDYITLSS